MSDLFSENYPFQHEERLVLENGIEVFIRPVLRSDADLLVDLFSRMSAQSVYLRFLRRLHSLPKEMVRRFTQVDYHREFALVAVINRDGRDSIIAVGRYGQNSHEEMTDLAVAVCDEWQYLGLGKILLVKIVEIAGEHGITRFTGMMDSRNRVIRHILAELGYEVTYVLKSGFFQVDIIV